MTEEKEIFMAYLKMWGQHKKGLIKELISQGGIFYKKIFMGSNFLDSKTKNHKKNMDVGHTANRQGEVGSDKRIQPQGGGVSFEVGDFICKPKGYKFDGVVVSIFENTSGQIRIVAELENNGMLHIFSPSQLEKK
jgi:hypothetical protein